MTSLLFVISNLNIGGPQKSLLALLDRIDYTRFEVTVAVMFPGGILADKLNPQAKVVTVPELVTAATLPSKNRFKWMAVLLKYGKLGIFADGVIGAIHFFVGKNNMNVERQRTWHKHRKDVPKMAGSYDAAFGILGLSTYYIADCVSARKKYHWIRSDSRILKRDEQLDALYFRNLDGFLSVSKECASIFESIYPFTRGMVRVFYNYIPLSFYESLPADASCIRDSTAKTKIITVCRIDPLKGIEMAIEACKILVSWGYDIHWFVLGDGPKRDEVENLISETGMSEHFSLLGFQLNTIAFLKEADILVHPSRTEGKSNAVDEAKYMGLPVIATCYPTVGEAIEDGITGLIADMNALSIARSVERVVNDDELAERLRRNCRGREDGPEDVNEYLSNMICEEGCA